MLKCFRNENGFQIACREIRERKPEQEGVRMTEKIRDMEHCEVYAPHADKVTELTRGMPEEEELYDLAELFKVFGDSTRIRILYALFEADVCVCDIAEALSMTQSAISHQLRILKQAKLVNSRRDGKQVIYSLADDHVRTIIGMGMEHLCE